MLDRYDQDLLLDYLEGELDEGQRAQLDAMLAEDPQLAALLSEMARDRAALRSLPQAEAPSDLVHDVTQTLERRMLLDDSVDDTTPIPISRAMAGEPPRSISWGRVVGLTGLAASVALAAGILVLTFDDTLQQTANEFADNTGADEAAADNALAAESAGDPGRAEGLAGLDQPDGSIDTPVPPSSIAGAEHDNGLDETAIADRGSRPLVPDSTPGEDLTDRINDRGAGDQPIEAFAFGSTAAISVMQPRQQLVLLSESPELSLEQLLAFCVDNGIPVVQPDQQAALAQARNLQDAPKPELAPGNGGADVNTVEPYADYALLINEEQLDTLVLSLNTSVAIEPKQAANGTLISNQAALVEELPWDAYGNRAAEQRQPVGADDEVEQAEQLEPAELEQPLEQQAIQLRSPDLGSDYANTRNAYNLLTQQQAGYAREEQKEQQPLADVDPGVDPSASAPGGTPESVAPKPELEQPEDNETAPDAQQPRTGTPDEGISDDGSLARADALNEGTRDNDAQRRHRQRIDPNRGNWLSAHLPVADTTPLRRRTCPPTTIDPPFDSSSTSWRSRRKAASAARRNDASFRSRR